MLYISLFWQYKYWSKLSSGLLVFSRWADQRSVQEEIGSIQRSNIGSLTIYPVEIQWNLVSVPVGIQENFPVLLVLADLQYTILQ